MSFGRKLKVGPLDDGVHGARFLAETTVDALRHVNIIPSGSSTTVVTHFCVDGNGLHRDKKNNECGFERGIQTQSMQGNFNFG